MSNETCSTQADNCQTPSQKGQEHCDMSEKLLHLADEAWMELLKEKIKKEIEASCGEQMNKVAKLVSETNKAKWSHKMAAKQGCHEYRHNLMALFSSEHCQK
jgi:hypothetical protein